MSGCYSPGPGSWISSRHYGSSSSSAGAPTSTAISRESAIDVLACPECGGRLELMAFISDAAVAARILEHLGLDTTGPPLARPKALDEELEPVPEHDVADPVYSE